MNVIDLMTRRPKLAFPEATLEEAAKTMRRSDTGALPVSENGRITGMLTDRDITTRATARGKVPATKVREAMSKNLISAYEDEDIHAAGRRMLKHHISRLPVFDRKLKLAGIVTLADIIASQGGKRLIKGTSLLGGIFRARYVVPVLAGIAIAGFIAAERRRRARKEAEGQI